MSEIVLYPGNWLYNAGVVGLLVSIERVEKLSNYYGFNNDGSVSLGRDIFNKLDVEQRYFSEERISSIVGKSILYRNFLQPSWKDKFHYFVESLFEIAETEDSTCCNLCYRKLALPEAKIQDLNSKDLEKFLDGIKRFDIRHNTMLGPSIGEFPNGFWDGNGSLCICPLCAFLIIHHHLSFIPLSDGSEIFINAPSFEAIWYLNKYAREVYGKEKLKTTKEILGISLIEAALKLNIQLGKWTMMNVEVVNRYKTIIDRTTKIDKIDFFSLPYEIVLLLSDNEIASLLDDIGEFSVLNLVLDGNFRRILELAERIFKIALKPEKERGTQEKNFMNDKVRLKKNKENLILFSQKLFKLYALIEEKAKKEVSV